MAARKAVGWSSLGGRRAQQAFEVVAARSFSRVSDFSFLGKIRWSTKCGKRAQIEMSVRRMVVVAQAVERRYSIREGRV